MINGLERNRYVYHYTGFDSLFCLLEGYRKGLYKGHLPFWGFNVFNANDPMEMKVGFNAVKAFICNSGIESEVPEIQKLSEVYENIRNEELCKKEYLGANHDQYSSFIPYTVSFSAKRDFMPMWSLYGKMGKGVSLVFDAIEMIENLEDLCQFGFVAYDKETNMNALNEMIPPLYKWYTDRNSQPTIETKINELSSICYAVSPFFKCEDYKYESEFRIARSNHYSCLSSLEGSSEEIKRIILRTITSNSSTKLVIPSHIDIPISINSLIEIIIGPCANFDVMEHIIRKELSECNLNNIKITPSKVPYRNK